MGKYGNVWNYEIHLNTLSSSSVEKDVQRACKLDASRVPEREKKEETSTGLQYTGSGVARIDCSKIKRPKQLSKRDREREDRKRRMGSIKLKSTARGLSLVSAGGETRCVVKRAIEIASKENELKRKRELVEERRKAIQKYLTSSSSSSSSSSQKSPTKLISYKGEIVDIPKDLNDSNLGACSITTSGECTKSRMQQVSFTKKHERCTKKAEVSSVRKKRKAQQVKRKNLKDFQRQEHKKKSRRSNQEHLLSFALDDD